MKKHINKLIVSLLAMLTCAGYAAAQTDLAISPARDGWYVQAGLDLSLQNPNNEDFTAGTFTKGRTGGIVVAVGREFSPMLDLRLRLNWENGFPPLSNKDATWLQFYKPDICNATHGGYASVVGDVRFNLHGIILPYRPDRVWNFQMFPRAGLIFNHAIDKGSPLLGLGIGSTFRMNHRCSLFVDAAYNVVSSGFNGKGTGVGTGSNGFFDATAGVQINLGQHGFHKL